jgi:starch-binding outer membrane protein, SusD/RagB family
MKRYILYILTLVVLSGTFASCSDFLNVESTTTVQLDKLQQDTVYPLFGVLAKFQKIADQYVVLGELRGELLTTTENADNNLREIEKFEVQEGNPYANVAPYYEIINNCNQFLADTNLIKNRAKYGVEFSTISAIRAWTYLQIGINYGKAVYLTKPIVNVDGISTTNITPIPFTQLIDSVYQQLWLMGRLDFGTTSYMIPFSCPPINFVLGELNMWKATLIDAEFPNDTTGASYNYYKAAAGYYKTIIQNDGTNSTSTDAYKLSTWYGGLSWSNMFSDTRTTGGLAAEILWTIIFDQNNGDKNNLIKLFSKTYGDYKLKPTDYIIGQWQAQKLLTGKLGDTSRGENNSWYMVGGEPVVEKFLYGKTQFSDNAEVYLARAGMIHLRYAEAVNRMNKPNLAMVAVNSGLNKANVLTVPLIERSPANNTWNFDDTRYNNAKGLRGRALLDVVKIPFFTNHADSINFVEDAILQEYALETAFEGNRWGDCLRVALRRKAKDAKYLSNLISQKFTSVSDAGTVYQNLLDEKKWYLPFPMK